MAKLDYTFIYSKILLKRNSSSQVFKNMFHLKISISIYRCKLINGVMLRLLQNILEIFKEVLNIILSVSIFIFYSFFFIKVKNTQDFLTL